MMPTAIEIIVPARTLAWPSSFIFSSVRSRPPVTAAGGDVHQVAGGSQKGDPSEGGEERKGDLAAGMGE